METSHGGVWIVDNFQNNRRLLRDLVVGSGQIAVFVEYNPLPKPELFDHLLIHTFTKPKNVVTTISFGTSAEAADSEQVSLMTKSGRNDDIEASLPQIRVVIADDHPVAREGLSAILGSLDDVKIVGEAADGEEACKLYHQHSPDVLIVDLRMPKKDGLRVVEELMSGGPAKPRIIVITTYEDEEDIRRAVKAGARGYLVKVADCEQIEEAVRAVAAGRSVFPTTSL